MTSKEFNEKLGKVESQLNVADECMETAEKIKTVLNISNKGEVKNG